jgi:hypothetical protein
VWASPDSVPIERPVWTSTRVSTAQVRALPIVPRIGPIRSTRAVKVGAAEALDMSGAGP